MTNTPPAKLLIVDDEVDMLGLLERSASTELDCEVRTANNAYKARELMESDWYDLVLLDIRMPGMDGMQLLEQIQKDHPDTTVVMMTAYGTIDLAVEAIKQGAYDFLTKPFELDKVIHVLDKALERSRLISENRLLHKRIRQQRGYGELVGSSVKMQKIFDTIRLVADSDATVLITGESGTGKDMVARAIHELSSRSSGPYVPVNCPNLPENILESELFGYRKGAFTHATRDKKGLFVEGEGGTIYLDEIGEILPTLQTKLLRVLQEKEIRPLGQTKSIKVDVRIIASTNRDLAAKMHENLFREDLFYRINVVSIHMPPLRERPEDIPLLLDHFLKKACKEFGKDAKTVSPELMQLFARHSWRGNVRELENVASRAVLFARGPVIEPGDLDWALDADGPCLVTESVKELPYKQAKAQVLQQFNREYLMAALQRNGFNVTRAARDCGLERQSFQQVMRRYGIRTADLEKDNGSSP